MLKRAFQWIVFTFLMCFQCLAQSTEPQKQPINAESVLSNTLNQMIYAYFGRDALLLFIDSQEEDAIRTASENELDALAAPFNPTISVYVVYVLSIIWAFNVFYFLFKVSVMLYEMLWYGQRKGSAQMDPNERRGIFFKIVFFGAIVLAPYKFSYHGNQDGLFVNAYVAGFFYLFGYESALTDDANEQFVKMKHEALQTIKIPRPENKAFASAQLAQFFACTRLDASRENVGQHSRSLPFYRDEKNNLVGRLIVGDCAVDISIGTDDEIIEMAERIGASNPEEFRIQGIDVQQGMINLYRKTLSSWLSSATKASQFLSQKNKYQTDVSADNVQQQFILQPFTSDKKSRQQLMNWGSMCPELWMLNSSTGVTERDRQVYLSMISKCISKEISTQLLTPPSITDVENLFKKGEISGRQIPVCLSNEDILRLRASKETPWIGETSKGGIDINGCINELCTSSSIQNGGAYACSNALSQVQRQYQNNQSIRRGVLTSGFYVFQQYTKSETSPAAKRVYAGLNANITRDVTELQSSRKQEFSIEVQIPEVNNEAAPNYIEILESLDESLTNPDVFSWTEPPPSNENWADDMLGQTRLFSCIKTPMQISKGYLCGTVPQEFNLFGVNLLRTVIALKTIVVMGDAMNRLQFVGAEKGTIGQSPIDLRKIVTIASWIGAGAIAEQIIDGTLDAGIGATDDFGYWDQQRSREWMSYSNLITGAMAVKAGSMASSLELVNSLLTMGLIFGLVFAIFIPLFPLMLVFGALSKMLYVITRVIAQTGILLSDGATDRQANGLLGRSFDETWMIWIAAFFKLPLMFIAILLSYVLSNVMISHMAKQLEFSFGSLISVPGVIDSLVLVVMVLIVMAIVYSTVLSIIETFYDYSMDWLQGKMNSELYSSRRGFGAEDSKELLGVLIGR